MIPDDVIEAMARDGATEVRAIDFAPGYFVDDLGNVYSARRCLAGCRKLRWFVSPRGYASVSLWMKDRAKAFRVNRLVLFAFEGPPPSPEHVSRHMDGNRGNNRRNNLQWGTVADNSADMERHGRRRRGTSMPTAKLTDDAVRFIRQSTKSQRAMAAELGVHPTLIAMVQKGKIWKHVDAAPSAKEGE